MLNIPTYVQFLFFITTVFFPIVIQGTSAQLSSLSNPPNVNQQFVTYQKHSNFIHEFNLPPSVDKHGLKGITTDSQGNPWFYDQTNKSSMIMKYTLVNDTFNSYPVEGKTVTDNPVINLAGGQLIYDQKRNSIWFTDARINVLGDLNLKNGKITLTKIPTNNSGIMGLELSPDNNTIWFTEIIGNKIGSYDIESNSIVEFPTGDLTGPTLLAFDNRGELWVTMSYSNSVLKVEPWLLVPGSKASGMSEVKLKKPDIFSAFGIGITKNKDNASRIFLSDHGSSRVIVSNLTSELNNYTSYWTSSSEAYPASLPSQIVSDKFGNIYFPQHGGNKISKISAETGLVTEFDIPTGPLATVVYLAVSPDAAKVWFTEWASNRIAYLDNTLEVPLDLKTQSDSPSPLVLKINQTIPLDVIVTRDNNSPQLLSVNQIELSVVGMTDAGLQGLTYIAKPQRFNLNETTRMNAMINLNLDVKEAIAGKYTVMERISTLERDNLTVSLLYPLPVTIDVPIHKSQLQNFPTSVNDNGSNTPLLVRDVARYASIGVAVTLIAYLVYRKIRQRRERRNKAGKNTQ
jgi:streptogramin lyase